MADDTQTTEVAFHKTKPVNAHCWEDGPLTQDGCPTTCLLAYGHSGLHEWTRDDEIRIKFV